MRQKIDMEIQPRHEALIIVLKQHFCLQTDDEELHRLTFAIIGMAVHFYVGQDIVTAISPKMLNTTRSIDTLAQSLAVYAAAMIEAESRRRVGGFSGEGA